MWWFQVVFGYVRRMMVAGKRAWLVDACLPEERQDTIEQGRHTLRWYCLGAQHVHTAIRHEREEENKPAST